MIQETSKQAYESIKEELGERQKQVLSVLEILGTANNRQISNHLKLPINSITPRIKELRDKKYVGVSKVDIDTLTNRKTIYWKLTKLWEEKNGSNNKSSNKNY
jgi:DNA-binding MarR family transcriptional regulator